MADHNKTKKGPKPPKHPCLRCRRAVTTDTKSVQCQTCEFWVHVDCQGISEELFNILVDPEKYGGVCWNCDSCLASSARPHSRAEEGGAGDGGGSREEE